MNITKSISGTFHEDTWDVLIFMQKQTEGDMYLEQIQDRILSFVVNHSKIDYESLKGLMLATKQLVKDVGSILNGKETVEKGIINEVGGIKETLAKLKDMIEKEKSDRR